MTPARKSGSLMKMECQINIFDLQKLDELHHIYFYMPMFPSQPFCCNLPIKLLNLFFNTQSGKSNSEGDVQWLPSLGRQHIAVTCCNGCN